MARPTRQHCNFRLV